MTPERSPRRSAAPRASSRPRDPQGGPPVLVITGDGLNCESETARAFRLAGGVPELVHISDILRGERRLGEFEILALIGGFSNGDHLGAGTVQASRFRHRLRRELEGFVRGGGFVIGICNGFQTLVKMGLLPGVARVQGGAGFGPLLWARNVTIMANDSGRFEDRWVRLTVDSSSPCVWTQGLGELFLPVRHGEGKFFAPDGELLDHLVVHGQVVLRYCDSEGKPTQLYPWNPNGSLEAIAGLCDPSGRVLGLMPHPEAYLSPYNHPSWTREVSLGRRLPPEGQGVALFRNAVGYVRERGG